jgi:hypothetical protein
MNPSPTHREIAAHVRAAFGATCQVNAFWDDQHVSSVDILSVADTPAAGVTSYGTIRLSDAPLLKDGQEYPVRAELVGACASSVKAFPNLLATAAFCVINSNWFCYPGAVFVDIVKMYKASRTMQHLYFTSPFLWENQLRAKSFGDRKVAWLLAMPISEGERRLVATEGSAALERRLEGGRADIFDINRPSVAPETPG